MTPAAPRNYLRLGALVVMAAVVIGAGIFASTLFGTATTTPRTTSTILSTSSSCAPTDDLAPPRHFAFNIAVNYTGPWNATAEGYSGNTPAFIECFTGDGVGLIYLSDWDQGGQATLQVVAQKGDSGGGNLSISIDFGATNSMAEENSTSLPGGSATITATILDNAAVASNFTTTTSAAGGGRLYDVTFQQSGDCSPPLYVVPWSVTLGNVTIAQPSNATLPITSEPSNPSQTNQSLSTIVFSVPDGSYQYTISPKGTFSSDYGSVTVNGAGVLVTVNGPANGCKTQG
ncbi:MAG: hypothetical protein OK442_08020 [Thaumarchaeota archaeon]|nr:hypothetical protein [Nitrososphaerota archaeon]